MIKPGTTFKEMPITIDEQLLARSRVLLQKVFRSMVHNNDDVRDEIEELLINIHYHFDAGKKLDSNQSCMVCGASNGTHNERGFERCNLCGYPGQ